MMKTLHTYSSPELYSFPMLPGMLCQSGFDDTDLTETFDPGNEITL